MLPLYRIYIFTSSKVPVVNQVTRSGDMIVPLGSLSTTEETRHDRFLQLDLERT
jgi:hypothetical protein